MNILSLLQLVLVYYFLRGSSIIRSHIGHNDRDFNKRSLINTVKTKNLYTLGTNFGAPIQQNASYSIIIPVMDQYEERLVGYEQLMHDIMNDQS